MANSHKNLNDFRTHGYVVLENYLDEKSVSVLRECAEILGCLPDKPGKIMKYYELSERDGGKILNRVEQFLDFFPSIDALLTSGAISEAVKLVTGISPTIFKEKINFKMPGGSGFNVHQDAPAFTRFIRKELVVVMIPVDKTDEKNGCLQVAENFFENEIIPHVDGRVEDSHLAGITWKNIVMNPSDILIFSSWLLHKSDKNLSNGPRRNYFVTYNDLQYGRMRNEYFDFKRSHFPPLVERKTDINYQSWISKLSNQIL